MTKASKKTETKTNKSPRDLRKSAGWSLEKAAALAGVAGHTARTYEANPAAVSEASRAKLNKLYDFLAGCDATKGPLPAPAPHPTNTGRA